MLSYPQYIIPVLIGSVFFLGVVGCAGGVYIWLACLAYNWIAGAPPQEPGLITVQAEPAAKRGNPEAGPYQSPAFVGSTEFDLAASSAPYGVIVPGLHWCMGVASACTVVFIMAALLAPMVMPWMRLVPHAAWPEVGMEATGSIAASLALFVFLWLGLPARPLPAAVISGAIGAVLLAIIYVARLG